LSVFKKQAEKFDEFKKTVPIFALLAAAAGAIPISVLRRSTSAVDAPLFVSLVEQSFHSALDPASECLLLARSVFCVQLCVQGTWGVISIQLAGIVLLSQVLHTISATLVPC
jgi:hypothetical protein